MSSEVLRPERAVDRPEPLTTAIPRDTVIRCEGVAEAFQLYMHRNDQLKQTLFGRWRQFYKEHWVLRDVSFAVQKGECVGIIGRNGAGKTTLLQILCGITAQTHGQATIKGRLAPILALGAGFDHELTGRENALIGGAILGLRKAQVVARMDSSGMLSRLAFAICAHADADILIVDEALSVGDAEFGAKCDAYIKRFAEHGTILVVSHDLATLEALCDRLVCIEQGLVKAIGAPSEIIPE